MTDQPFPNLQAPLTAANGTIHPVWRSLLATMWQRTGGSAAASYALLNGSSSQVFNVKTAVTGTEAVPLAQAQADFAPISGSSTQVFNVADAVTSTEAVSLGQAQSDFATPAQVPTLIADATGAAIASITVTASPFAYAATARGYVNIDGGTVSGVTLTRGATVINLPIAGIFPVANGDTITVTYSAAPTMDLVPF